MAEDIAKICRTCLGVNAPLLSIYEGDDDGGCIADMLRDFTKTKPCQDDKLPKGVCLACISEINRCYLFKIRCENSCRTLRQFVLDALPKELCDPQKVKVLHYNKSVQTQPEFTKQIKTVGTQTKIILAPERNDLQVQTSPQRNTTPLIFEGTKIGKNLEVDVMEQIEITETAATGYVQVLSSNDFDLSDDERNPVIMKFEVGDEDVIENVLETTTFSPLHSEKGDESNEDAISHYQLSKEQRTENDIENQAISNQTQSKNSETNLEVNTSRSDYKTKLRSKNTKNVTKNTTPPITPQTIVAKTKSGGAIYLCERCGKGFSSHRHILNHTKDSLCSKRDLRNKCPICKKVFDNNHLLNNHLRVHSGEKPFICTICKKAFAQKAYLRIHVLHHSTERRYKCPDCVKSFVTKYKLCTHRFTHTGEYPFRCDKCQASYPLASTLAKHKQKKHTESDQTHDSGVCEPERPGFISGQEQQSLPQHSPNSSGSVFAVTTTTTRTYICNLCSKSFTSPVRLENHRRVHTREIYKKRQKNHTCFCGKKFSYLAVLHRHMESHDNAGCKGSGADVEVNGVGDKRKHSSNLLENNTTTNIQRHDSVDKEKVDAEAGGDVDYDQNATTSKFECAEVVSKKKPMQLAI